MGLNNFSFTSGICRPVRKAIGDALCCFSITDDIFVAVGAFHIHGILGDAIYYYNYYHFSIHFITLSWVLLFLFTICQVFGHNHHLNSALSEVFSFCLWSQERVSTAPLAVTTFSQGLLWLDTSCPRYLNSWDQLECIDEHIKETLGRASRSVNVTLRNENRMTSSWNSLNRSEPQFEFSTSLCVSSICLQLWSLACLILLYMSVLSRIPACLMFCACVWGWSLTKSFPMHLLNSTEFIALERNKELFLKMSLIEFYKGNYFTDPTRPRLTLQP